MMDKIIASVPMNSTAARVTAKGVHYEYKRKPAPEHVRASADPLPIVIPAGAGAQKVLAEIVGRTFGRWRVLGYAAKQSKQKDGALYVVKCSCGRYEHRRMKAIRRASDTGDRCADCQNLAFIKRQYKELGSKPISAFTHATDGADSATGKGQDTPNPHTGEAEMSDDMVDFLARAQYAANSWWRAAKDDDDGLGRYKMHGDVRLRAIEWEHLYADEQDDFLQSARAILTAIEASGRRIVPVDPKSRARELWEDAARDALSASPKVTT